MRTIPTIGLAEAHEILHHILDVAYNDGLNPVAICVVDATGMQLSAATMDGTKEPSIATAHAKAVTAIKFQRDTMTFCHAEDQGAWYPASTSNGEGWNLSDILAAMKINAVFSHWGGGVLIRSPHDNAILGAVGVSNRTEEQDHNLAAKRPSSWAA